MDNYIRINQNEWSTPIFRFTTVDRLLQLVVESKNTLVSPRKWKDPFENILSRVPCRKANDEFFMHPLRERVYGQCWTMVEETDATWRMYVPDANGVRLKTTIRKLHQSLHRSLDYYASISCFIGRVEYVDENEILARLSSRKWNKEHFLGVGSQGQAESLLFKREAFLPEQEIRILYLDPHNVGCKDVFSYEIDASRLIDQITFDPRMEDNLYEAYSAIVRKYGYSGDVEKSTLYQLPISELPV